MPQITYLFIGGGYLSAKEFILPYEAVRQSNAPEKTLLDFMQSTYEVGANLDKWNRAELERKQVTVG